MSYQQDVQNYNSGGEDTLQSEAMRKLFVGGLNRETTQDSFNEYFSQYGTIVDSVIISDPNTQQSRGFGFITYENSNSIQDVFKTKPHELDGKTMDVKRAMPREFNTAGAHSKTTRLFIGGFKGLDLEPDELREYIESRHSTDCGRLDQIDFLKDKETNQNKGFGFLDCSDTDFADRLAISESTFSLKGRQMSIKKAEPKDGSGQQGGGGGRGGSRGGRGGPRGGRGGAGRGRGGGRGFGGSNYSGGYNDNSGYNNYNQNSYGSSQSGYGGNQSGGYGGNQGGYGGNQGSYNQGYGSYGASQGSYNGGGYQQQTYGSYGSQDNSTYNSNNSYSQGYNQSSYGSDYNQQSSNGGGAQRGGRGGNRGGGNNRYQPY